MSFAASFRARIATGTLLLLAACATVPPPSPGLSRAIWVTRFDYRTAADIERVIADCADAGFRAVLFQVRGNGTVYYESSHEVWSEAHGFRSPGFDPLHVAVQAAHRRGLELHAWVNVLPGWRGDTAKADARQLVRSRSAWFLGTRDGEPQPLEGGYYWLNPCKPEVRDYVVSICGEIAARYGVDGVHLDHVRFSDLAEEQRSGLPSDEKSRSLFEAAHGVAPEAAPERFLRWKTDCVTQLVAAIRARVATVPRRPVLSAAVWRDPDEAQKRVHQDWARWTRDRLVDVVVPMNYDDDDGRFGLYTELAVHSSHSVPVVMGVGCFKHDSTVQTVRQLDAALRRGAEGVALFGYAHLFGQRERASVLRDAWR